MADEYIYFRCLEIRQPIGVLYVGTMDSSQVTFISYADVRRIEAREVEQFVGIQRPLEPKRVSELQQYVRTIDASFPTSVILAVNSDDALYDSSTGIMRINRKTDIAKIIDGQHRIAGLLNYEGRPFQLNVSIFVDMDIEDQALLFATINLKQTKVNRSLAYDLFEFAVSRSPQKTCHNIAKVLHSREGSPLYGRIKILGRATGKRLEFLTQALVVERLIRYISSDAMQDRDRIKRKKKLERAVKFQEKEQKLIFRNMFIDERDDDITLALWNYFTAVANKWPTAWNTSETGYVLNRSAGFGALMKILPDVYLSVAEPGDVPTVRDFAKIFSKVDMPDTAFIKDVFIPGSGGESRLVEQFYEHLGLHQVGG